MSNSSSWQNKLAPIFTLTGFMIVMLALIIGLFVLAPTASHYFGDIVKATRDSAVKGDSLQGSLVVLTSTPHWLKPLVFFGVALFMTGIALLFSTIPGLLRERGDDMSSAFNDLARLSNK